jgi:hypothetical protein
LRLRPRKTLPKCLVKFESAVAGERQLLVNELRQASVKAAIELTRGQLASQTSADVKANLLNQFMEQLETLNTKSLVSSGALESVSK